MKLEDKNLNISKDNLPLIKRIADQMPCGFFIYKADGDEEFIYFNPAMVKIMNCSSDKEFIELTHNSFKNLVHPDDIDDVEKIIAKQLYMHDDNTDHVRYRVLLADGSLKYFDDYGFFVRSDDFGDIFYVFIEDVTSMFKLQSVELTAKELSDEQKKIEHIVQTKISKTVQKSDTFVGMKFIIIDDDELTRTVDKGLLEDQGAAVFEACDLESALKAYKKQGAVDAILINKSMRGHSGLEITKAIRDLEKDGGIRVPIIVMTTELDAKSTEAILEAGANDYLEKPLIIADFSRVLISCMKLQSEYLERKLADTIRLASTDALTSVKSITAYTEKVAEISKKMGSKEKPKYAVVMCDINGLKYVNDTYGHNVGDIYIKNCCHIICNTFSHSPVYRIGGDEFVAVLQSVDYQNREFLVEKLLDKVLEAEKIEDYHDGKASFAFGMAVYEKGIDNSFADVIKRADASMYEYKEALKK